MAIIYLPKEIRQKIPVIKGNRIVRLCSDNDIDIETSHCQVVSTEPFMFVFNNDKYAFVKNSSDNFPKDCKYVVQTRLKTKKKAFEEGNVECLEWLKHPAINKTSTTYIVESWENKFHYLKEDLDKNIKGLRAPQLGALFAFMSETQMPKDRNIIVMPTGTGKTETMLSILIANQCKKLLVTVPSDALRSQLAEKFITLGVLPKFGIVDKDCKYPYVGIVEKGMDDDNWKTLITKSNVIITTMHLLCNCNDKVKSLLNDSCSNIFIDEAHHTEAPSWSNTIDFFEDKKVTLFTATPFRNDGQKLRGKFIYTFSLRDAQNQGYYKPIELHTIREYDKTKSDEEIAEKAVNILKRDLDKGYDHILMARCASKKRANEIFKYYEKYKEYKPIVIHSDVATKVELLQEIKNKKHRIIVCVNMLGEGFDLPEMKIAALHDQRQSIPVTLQFIGRFTRTSYDNNLGNASFIANVAFPPIANELEQLYSSNADWNELLPQISDDKTHQEVDFNKFISDFSNIESSDIPFQQIRPALSTVIYKITNNTWHISKWDKTLSNGIYEYKFMSHNNDGNTILIVLGRIANVDWGNVKTVQNLKWDIVIIHRHITPKYKHIYVNTTDGGINTYAIVESICGEKPQRINGDVIFRALDGMRVFSVVNFGGREGRVSPLTFRSFYGRDIQKVISQLESGRLIKNNIFGNGRVNGDKTSIGCSKKGRVWSYMRGNILQFCDWCEKIGEKIEDETIDPDVILSNTLKVEEITERPKVVPIRIDWADSIYRAIESRVSIGDRPFWEVELELDDFSADTDTVKFKIIINDEVSRFTINYSTDQNVKEIIGKYKVIQQSGPTISLSIGSKAYVDITDYFNEYGNLPAIGFADGSSLFGTKLVRNPYNSTLFNKEKLKVFDWTDVDLNKESQGEYPYIKDSIQYKFANYLKTRFNLVYDDDGSGEIADLIGINIEKDFYDIHLYHLKFAMAGKVSSRIDNFYAVCGQAEKSLKWCEYENKKKFADRLLARIKGCDRKRSSRLLKGSEDDLISMRQQIEWKKEVRIHINIVQPSLSKDNADKAPDILKLLGIVSEYMEDYGNIDFNVYCSK